MPSTANALLVRENRKERSRKTKAKLFARCRLERCPVTDKRGSSVHGVYHFEPPHCETGFSSVDDLWVRRELQGACPVDFRGPYPHQVSLPQGFCRVCGELRSVQSVQKVEKLTLGSRRTQWPLQCPVLPLHTHNPVAKVLRPHIGDVTMTTEFVANPFKVGRSSGDLPASGLRSR